MSAESRIFCLLFSLTAFQGCAWLTGVGKMDCDVSDIVGASVENTTTQDLQVGFCSEEYTYPVEAKEIPAGVHGGYTTKVNKKTVTIEGKYANSCGDNGVRGGSYLGDQFPLLADADRANFKFCYGEHFSDEDAAGNAFEWKGYKILRIHEACPVGSVPYDQSTVNCKQ